MSTLAQTIDVFMKSEKITAKEMLCFCICTAMTIVVGSILSWIVAFTILVYMALAGWIAISATSRPNVSDEMKNSRLPAMAGATLLAAGMAAAFIGAADVFAWKAHHIGTHIQYTKALMNVPMGCMAMVLAFRVRRFAVFFSKLVELL